MFEDLPGLVPFALAPRAYKLMLEDHTFAADIGFHEFEIGAPQRLLATIEVWLDPATLPQTDARAEAWDYDFLRHEIARLTDGRRFNLQETLAGEIYDLIAARRGVRALRVRTRKLDVYPDTVSVGVELASFEGGAPRHGPSWASTNA